MFDKPGIPFPIWGVATLQQGSAKLFNVRNSQSIDGREGLGYENTSELGIGSHKP